MTSKRLVFLGTPEIAVPPLRAIHAAGHDVALVVTGADRRRGRGAATSPSPVKAAALELGLPVSHVVDDVIHAGAELGVVVAFGRIIKPHVLATVPMINMHFSLLPRWRGAAPLERALLAGDTVTGVCIMDVDDTLDTGAVYRRAEVPIGPRTTAAELRSTLVDVGTHLLVEVLAGELPTPEPQVGEATYAAKLTPEEWRLDWSSSADQLDRWVRAGGAWTTFRGQRLGVFAAEPVDPPGPLAAGELAGNGVVGAAAGALRLLAVQPAGKRTMSWGDFANGVRPHPGEHLGA